MFAPRYFAPAMFAPRYFPPASDVEPVETPGLKSRPGFRDNVYLAQAIREDEELLLIARAFIEIIKCR